MEIIREPQKPIQTISYTVIIGLLLLAIVEGGAFITGGWRIISYALVPDTFSLEESSLVVDTVYQTLNVVQGFANVAISFVFGVWLYRMNVNLREISPRKMEFTPGWMIAWYFIPIANLFKPFQGMQEMWRISHKDWNANPTILRWWWGLWLVGRFLGDSSGALIAVPDTAQAVINNTSVLMGFDLLNVALDIVALRMITSIWAAYEDNYLLNDGSADEDPSITIHELKDQQKAQF